MNYKMNDNAVLTLYPKNRIDSSNASAVEAEIKAILAETQPKSVIIDAEELAYISSAGLRIILKLRKSFAELRLINASSDVYDIFNMTGFTEMMTVEKALRKLDVSNCEIINEGAHGAVYRIDPETIVKVYKRIDNIADIHRERDLSRKAFVMGIPTAIPYDVVKVGESYGAVFELLNAKSFAQLIAEGASASSLAQQSVEILKIIHNTTMKDDSLPNKKPEAITWAQRSAKYLPAEIGDKLIALFEDIPDSRRMMHGDFHIKNIMQMNGENLLIDMDTLSMGHPIYEFSAIFSAYEGFAAGGTNACADFLGISKEACSEFLSATFSSYFADKTEQEVADIRLKASVISYTRIYRWMIEHYGLDSKDHQTAIEYCRDFLITNVPKIEKLYY